MPRLFSALELPDACRMRLAALRVPFPGARWIAPDDYHITLRFVGELTRREADEWARALADLDAPSPVIRIKGTGAFGGKQPSAIFAAVDPTPDLLALAAAHDRAARALGFAPDKRKFQPHVTLARLQHSDDGAVARFLERTGTFQFPIFRPERAVMMSARENGGGPYGVVDAFAFPGMAFEGEA